MIELLGALVAQGIGVALSPLAIVVLLAVLGTGRARVNGVAFALGWLLALVGVLGGALLLVDALDLRAEFDPPRWLGPLHLVLAALLLGGAVVIWRRGRARLLQTALASTAADTVAAAPNLPRWLASVEHFGPGRCLVVGVASFVLNPVDVSCTVGAAVDLATSPVGTTGSWVATGVFLLLGNVTVAGPVVWYLAATDRAALSLHRLQTWIAGRSHLANAVVIGLIGVMQLSKAFQAF